MVFVEIVWTQTAISSSHAIQVNYSYFPYLFKSNTMQHIFPIINSLRQPNLRKPQYSNKQKKLWTSCLNNKIFAKSGFYQVKSNRKILKTTLPSQKYYHGFDFPYETIEKCF